MRPRSRPLLRLAAALPLTATLAAGCLPVALAAGRFLGGRAPFSGPPAVPACAEPAVDTTPWPRIESPSRGASFRVPAGFTPGHQRDYQVWSPPPEFADPGTGTGWRLELTWEPRFRPPQGLGSAPLRDMHDFERRPTQRTECTLAVAGRAVRVATYIERSGPRPYMATALVHFEDVPVALWLVAYGRRPADQEEFLAVLRTLRFGRE